MALVLGGSVESFDRDSFKANLAASVGVAASDISLEVSPGSINVVATFVVADESAATGLASKLQVFAGNASALLPGVAVESVGAPVMKTVVLSAPPSPPASVGLPPTGPVIATDNGGGLFATVLDSFENWEVYEYAAVGGAALLLCCCCVGCICRRRLRLACARACPCCPCSRNLEASRRAQKRQKRQLAENSSSSLHAGSDDAEGKRERKERQKREKKQKAERETRGKKEKPKAKARASWRGAERLPTMCVGVLNTKTPHGASHTDRETCTCACTCAHRPTSPHLTPPHPTPPPAADVLWCIRGCDLVC